MRIIFLIWLLFGGIYFTTAQTVTIKDQETNKPIDLVSLISENPVVFVETNSKGQAEISAFKGAPKIIIRALGYKTIQKSYDELANSSSVIMLEYSEVNLEEMVVSGTKWHQTSFDIPSNIVSISSKEVNLQNPQTAADLLSISGNVFIQKSQQGGGSPMIRGFATNRLLYSVDGVRMNTAIFRGGNVQNIINLDPLAIENTEVLFGPGSVIYGSDAIGGVMSFKTLTPQFSLNDNTNVSGKAVTRYSTANKERMGHFDVNIGKKKWAFITSFSSWEFDNLRQGKYGPSDYIKDYYVQRQDSMDVLITQEDPLLQIPSAYSQVNMMQKIRFKPTENWEFQYSFHYSETTPYGRYDRHNRMKNGTARYAEWSYGPQSWMMNNLMISHKGSKKLYNEMAIRIAQQSFEESRISRSFNEVNRSTNKEKVEASSVNVDFNKSLGKRDMLYYGIEYVYDDVQSTGNVKDIATGAISKDAARYPNANWSSAGVYINNDFKIKENLTIQSGVRFNQNTLNADFSNNLEFYPFSFTTAKISKNAVTGSLGGVWRPSKKWALSTNLGTAFRAPNVDDIGKIFDSEPGSITIPNPNLKAEYAYNLDFGIAKVFNEYLKIDFTGYYTILENALVRRNFQFNDQDSIMFDGVLSQVQAIQNAAYAKIYGAQFGFNFNILKGLSLSTDINYQIGEEELDDGTISASRHAAPLFGVARLNYKAKDLILQFYVNYQGEKQYDDLPVSEQGKDEIYAKDRDGNNYSPEWYTLNVKASYNVLDLFIISSGIENITDQRYRPYSSGLSGAGRNFVFSLRYNF